MDIIEFIQSKTIADYLRKIDYKFTPFESVYIMYSNKLNVRCTLKERHTVSEEIIVALSGGKTDKEKRLCTLLNSYMEWENKLVAEIYADDIALYRYELFGSKSGGWYMSDDSYRNFSECLADVTKRVAEINKEGEDKISGMMIRKESFDSKRELQLTMTVDKEIIYPQVMFGETDEEKDLDWAFYGANDLFEDVEIPMPFKKGDILFQSYGFYNAPMSDTALYTVLKESTRGKCGICFGTYRDGDSGTQELMRNDFTYEYYCGEFSGYKRLAKAVAEYVNGKIELAELFVIRDIINLEEKVNDRKGYLSNNELKLIKTKRAKAK